MTLRELNGWAPATVTYGRDGGVLSVSVTEARFTRAEKALLLEARRRALEPRGSHGIRISEASDPANDPTSWDASGQFVVPLPAVDFAADALRRAKADWPDDDDRPLLWRVEKRPVSRQRANPAPRES